jgi:hypothetical protein
MDDATNEARRFAVQVAERILAGTVRPYDGARQIWRWVSEHDQVGIQDLGSFIGLASEWDDSPQFRPSLEADIIDEARLVVERFRHL